MKVAIAGYGVEGKSNYRYYNELGHEVTILDESAVQDELPDTAKSKLGEAAFSDLERYELVVRTAGLAPKKIATARKIWSATNEFFAKCPVPIIGITGTKGKGTTASLIAAILRSAGVRVHLVGNIGNPALDNLSDIKDGDIVVYEMSSFQLWDLKKSPNTAVVLMIEADHLDIHESFKEYIEAKSNITRHQKENDVCVFHPSNVYSAELANYSNGSKVRYGIDEDGGVYVREGSFYHRDRVICPTSAMQIPGAHNIENACAAITAALPYIGSVDSIEAGLREFTGLPHRLKFIKTVDNVEYYDDSIATTPGSSIAALKAFSKPKVIILGGHDKGSEYIELVSECKNTSTKVIAIGQTSDKISKLCEKQGVFCQKVEGNMKQIVAAARVIAEPGSVVLLSPASASFGAFKNYSDRGDQFIAAVNRL